MLFPAIKFVNLSELDYYIFQVAYVHLYKHKIHYLCSLQCLFVKYECAAQ
jgi:hypothetical protein